MSKIMIDRALVEQALGALDVAAACIDVYYVPRGKKVTQRWRDSQIRFTREERRNDTR
jgi:hypothetical protein